MALLFMDSFDHFATADILEKWTTGTASGTGSAITITAGAGRHSSAAWRWAWGTNASSGTGGWQRKTLSPGDATAVMGFAFRTSGAPGTGGVAIAWIDQSGTPQVTLRLNIDLTLSVCLGGPSGSVLATSAVALTIDTYAYLEWKVLLANAGGTVEVRVNGTAAITFTGDTQATATATWTAAAIGHPSGVTNGTTATSRNLDVDDLYVLDGTGSAPGNTFLGDCRVDKCLSTAPGATTDWTPNTGANWDAVNDAAPDDDTTYNATATLGAIDTFVTENAPVPGALIYGIQHCVSMKKSAVGLCTVAPVIRHGGVDYPGAALSPGVAYAYGLQLAPTNPATGTAWVQTHVNAAEFGYKRVV